MSEIPDRTTYEVTVGRHVSPATLATFPVALVPTAVPRNTVRRLRVGADRDMAEIVRRLTERNVELLEIRRCPQSPRRRPLRGRSTVPQEPEDSSGVVVPLPRVDPEGGGASAPEPDREPVAVINLSRSGAGGPRLPRPRRRIRG